MSTTDAQSEWAISVLVILSSAHLLISSARMEYIKDLEKLETLFMVLNPDINETMLLWKEMEGVTPDVVKIVCDSVAREIFPNFESVTYVSEFLEPEQRNISERMLIAEMLVLEDTVVTVPVLKCSYKHTVFYLTRASSDSVFVLRRDVQVFRLDSGLYEISFTT